MDCARDFAQRQTILITDTDVKKPTDSRPVGFFVDRLICSGWGSEGGWCHGPSPAAERLRSRRTTHPASSTRAARCRCSQTPRAWPQWRGGGHGCWAAPRPRRRRKQRRQPFWRRGVDRRARKCGSGGEGGARRVDEVARKKVGQGLLHFREPSYTPCYS